MVKYGPEAERGAQATPICSDRLGVGILKYKFHNIPDVWLHREPECLSQNKKNM